MEFTGDAAMLHLSVVYENGMDLNVIDRDAGTYFDWISSAGGLNKGLRLILRLIVSFFNYNVYSVYMVSQLFKLANTKLKRRKSTLTDKIDRSME